MNFQQFLFTIISSLQSSLPAEDVLAIQTIENEYTTKIKAVSLYHGSVRKSPMIYMAPFYRMHQSGYATESIERELKSVLSMTVRADIRERDIFLKFASASPYLAARLISCEGNREFLKMVPHRRFLDLALVYQLVFDCGEGALGAALVYLDHCSLWGITEDILFQSAMFNMVRQFPVSLERLDSVLSVLGIAIPCEAPQLYVLSNSKGFFGATALLYPGVLRSACDRLGEEYYVLPSSVHEVLLLSKDSCFRVSELKEIVKSVNLTEVAPEEVLSEEVYCYSMEREQLCVEGS